MITRLAIVLVPFTTLGAPRLVSAQSTSRTTIELRASGDALSAGHDAWQEHALVLQHRASARTGAGLTASWLQRFGQVDRRGQMEASLGIGRRLTLGVEGETSPTHRVVARVGGAARGHVSLGAGWGMEGRAFVREFDVTTVRGGHVLVERYWSHFLASYAVSPVRVEGAATATSHTARLARFWGERGVITLGGSAGREVENLGGSRVVAMAVQSAGAWGALPLSRHLDLTFASGVTRQGDLFMRTHLSVGARVVSR